MPHCDTKKHRNTLSKTQQLFQHLLRQETQRKSITQSFRHHSFHSVHQDSWTDIPRHRMHRQSLLDAEHKRLNHLLRRNKMGRTARNNWYFTQIRVSQEWNHHECLANVQFDVHPWRNLQDSCLRADSARPRSPTNHLCPEVVSTMEKITGMAKPNRQELQR